MQVCLINTILQKKIDKKCSPITNVLPSNYTADVNKGASSKGFLYFIPNELSIGVTPLLRQYLYIETYHVENCHYEY